MPMAPKPMPCSIAMAEFSALQKLLVWLSPAFPVGAIAAAHDIAVLETLTAFVTAAVHGQISVAVRLIPLGQTDGLQVMAALEPLIETVSIAAVNATLADLGSIAYAADIAQMRHE